MPAKQNWIINNLIYKYMNQVLLIAFTYLAWYIFNMPCKKRVYLKRWQKLKTHRPSFKLIGGTQGKQFSYVFSLGEFVITRLSKKCSAYSFVCILLKNDTIPRILQLQCFPFGEIVITTVEDGSLTRILFSIKWMRLSRIWRIKQIEEGVIYRGRSPRWITPSDSFIPIYSFKIIPKHAYVHRY